MSCPFGAKELQSAGYLADLMVRQAKFGASCRVKVPVGYELATHPYRVLRLWRSVVNGGDTVAIANKRGEAYTENPVGQRGDASP
jgi:hypothetical protein